MLYGRNGCWAKAGALCQSEKGVLSSAGSDENLCRGAGAKASGVQASKVGSKIICEVFKLRMLCNFVGLYISQREYKQSLT